MAREQHPAPAVPERRPAPPAFSVVRRERLVARLHEAVHRRLSMLVAPPGYGKTTLVRDFLASCADAGVALTACWYTVAPWEADGRALLAGLTAALRAAYPAFGGRTLRWLDGSGADRPELQQLVAAVNVFVAELRETVADYTLLVIDDYHLADAAPSARRTVELLLREAPPHIHCILLARAVPSLDTSALLLADELGALGPRELAFTRAELDLVLRERYGVAADAALLDEIYHLTEGWIAGVVLAMPAASGAVGRPEALRATLLAAAGDGRLHEYLASQLFDRQTPEDQELLLAAALPDAFTPTDVDRVLGGADAAAALDRLERAGAPLTRTAERGQPYRLHSLMQGFLRVRLQRLDPARYALLQERWGAVAEARGDDLAALGHYVAGDLPGRIAAILERAGEHWVDAGRRQTVEEALGCLPAAEIQSRPRVGLCAARLALAQGAYALAVERARQARFAARRCRDAVSAVRAQLLEAAAYVASGRPEEAQALCEQALTRRAAQRSKPLLAEIYRSLGGTDFIRGLPERALGPMEQALALYEQVGMTWDVAVLLNNLGGVHEQLGQADQARTCHVRSLALRRELGDLSGVGASLVNLGLLQFYQGAYADADAAFVEAGALAARTADALLQAAVQVNLGDLRRAQQRPGEALACYRAAEEAARGVSDPRWRGYAWLGEAAANALAGAADAAEHEARQALELAERHGLAEVAGQAQVVLASLAHAAGRRRAAAALIDAARRAVDATKSKTLQVRAYLWAGQIAHAQKRWGEALACVQLAAEAATALGGPGLLAAEGPPIVPLLRTAAGRHTAPELLARALDDLDATAAAAVRESAAPAPTLPAALPAVELHLCGPFRGAAAGRAIEGDVPARSRVRELLAYLAVHPAGRRREEIGADLWPDAEPGQDVTLTYTTLHRLRQALFPELISGEGATSGVYRFNPEVAADIDVLQFEALLQDADAAPTADERRALLIKAAAVYGGPFFEECYADWAARVRQHLERRYTAAVAELADAAWKASDYRACLAWCERLFEAGLAEASIHVRAMLCHERLGQSVAGILLYRRYAQDLAERSAERPSREAALIFERLRQVATAAGGSPA